MRFVVSHFDIWVRRGIIGSGLWFDMVLRINMRRYSNMHYDEVNGYHDFSRYFFSNRAFRIVILVSSADCDNFRRIMMRGILRNILKCNINSQSLYHGQSPRQTF